MVPSKLLSKFSHFVVRRPIPILIVLGILTVLAVVETRKIKFDFSPQSVIAGNDEELRYAEEFKKRFGYEDALLFVVLQQIGENDVLDKNALEWQLEIAEELKALPHVKDVTSAATLRVPQFSAQERTKFVPIVDQRPVDSAVERRVRNLVDASSLMSGTLISEDRSVAAILVSMDPKRRDLESMRQDVNSVRKLLQDHQPPDGYKCQQQPKRGRVGRILESAGLLSSQQLDASEQTNRSGLSGLPVLRADIVDGLQAEQTTLLPIAAVFFLIVLVVVFRRISGTLIPMLAVGMGLAWTVGIMAAAGESFNILSNMLPVLLMIIGVSNSVHIVCRYAEESERFHGDRKAATIETIQQMAIACMLTYLTTAIGFGSLATAHSEILRDFGWQAAMGVVLLYICLMLTMGTTLPYFRAPSTGAVSGELSLVSRAMSAIANGVARRPVASIMSVIVVVIASFWVARNLEINSTMLETFESTHPTVQTLNLVEDKLAGILPFEICLEGNPNDPGKFLEPSVYRKVAEFERYARQQPAVLFAQSYVDLHQDVYANFKKDPKLFNVLPADDEEGARQIQRSMKFIDDADEVVHYNVFFSREHNQARVLLRVRDVGTRNLLIVADDLKSKLAELFPPGSGIKFVLTGDAYLNAHSMDQFVSDLFWQLLTAAGAIFIFIGVLFRSLKLGLLAAIPNTTPMAVTLGYMGLRGYDLNAGNVIVFTICLGIVVDDTIHFLTRYREEMAKENNVWKAIERSYHGTGRAIVLMTMLIVSGLSVLLLSDFVPTRRFAELTTLTMIVALFGDLLLLPASLVLFRDRKSPAKPPDSHGSQDSGAADRNASSAPRERQTIERRPESD